MTGISVIIPNLNGQKFLSDCLSSILVAQKNLDLDLQIILVDNGSTDQSLEIFDQLTKNYQTIKIRNSKNLGFAQAVNQGIAASSYDWVHVCNNDLKLHPEWYKKLLPYLRPEYACLAGTVLNLTGNEYESTGLTFFDYGKCQNIKNHQKFDRTKLPSQPEIIWGANAACTLYYKPVLRHLGGFDARFFAYEEDVDLAYRLNQQKFTTLYVPLAISYHLGGGTSNKMGIFRQKMDAKNWWLLILKNYSLAKIIQNLPKLLLERFINLASLYQAIIKTYGWRSIYLIPMQTLWLKFSILYNLLK